MNIAAERAEKKQIILATRKSALAMWQARTVQDLIQSVGFSAELLPTVTSGDKLQKGALADKTVESSLHLSHLQTGKGLFVKEIQEHMLAGLADIAVHSMKDLPVARTPGLEVVGILPRAAFKDVLILSPQVLSELNSHFAEHLPFESYSFAALQNALLKCPTFLGGVVGTTSARRQMQMRATFTPDLKLEVLRGNVDTRLERVRNNEFAAILLANAGLNRLNLFRAEHMIVLPPDLFIPAPAQGIIAIETVVERTDVCKLLAGLSHLPTLLAGALERLTLDLLGGDCHTAVAVHYHSNAPASQDGNDQNTVQKSVVQRAFLNVECGRNEKCIRARFDFKNSHVEFLNSELKMCEGNYTAFLNSVEQSAFARELREFLWVQNFATVSSLQK